MMRFACRIAFVTLSVAVPMASACSSGEFRSIAGNGDVAGYPSGGISGAGTSGSAGTGATGGALEGGAAGDAGAAGGSPCDGKCGGKTPVCDAAASACVECLKGTDCRAPKAACDTATNKCVECVGKGDCDSPKPACDTAANKCVECLGKADCKDGAKPFCETAAAQCVACLKQADCTAPTASACDAGACKPCTVDAECSNITGKGVCDVGTCVQCTGKKYSACGSSMGAPLICDSLLHTCSASKQASAGLCQPCVSDAQCTPGKMCVQEQFGSPAQSVGYFCFWKKGDTANGAPGTCLPGADPYAATLKNSMSIDGATADICNLSSSTCVALNQFKNKNCANPALPDDSLCGFAPTKDSKCVQADVGVFRCTMTCLGDDDCPGVTCNKGVSPFVCNLN